MNRTSRSLLAVLVFVPLPFVLGSLGSQEKPSGREAEDPAADLRNGKRFVPTPETKLEDDLRLLALFAGLRVADVSDGLDAVGLQGIGHVSSEIHPLWRDTENYRHRIIGVAVTARYVPTQSPPAGKRDPAEFDRWESEWYRDRSPEPFVPLLREGSVLVIDDDESADVGSIGSNNIMGWKLRGCRGVVTDATARDTDEIETEKVPLYFRGPGRGIRPGRNEIESVNLPIVCAGALVVPGDIIVADGDGVVVVPRAHAEEVAKHARRVLEGDKAGRRQLYERLGLPEDPSVK